MKREIWLDNLRIIAIYCVVLIHCTVSTTNNTEINSESILLFPHIYNSATRFCVPLFVMISGAVSLNNKSLPAFQFYKKRVLRMLRILFFWGIVYILFNHIFESPYNVKGLIGSFLLSSTPGSVHLWFLYLIIELYFLTPFIYKIWDKYSSSTWLFFSLIGTISLFTITPILLLDINSAILFSVKSYPQYLSIFISFIPYYIAGKAIKELEYRFSPLMIFLISIIFITSTVYTVYFSFITKNNSFISYTSINVYLSTLSIYCLFYNFPNKPIIGKVNLNVAFNSFGIYLIHMLVRDSFSLLGIDGDLFFPAIWIPIYALFVFMISYYFSILLKNNAITKLFV